MLDLVAADPATRRLNASGHLVQQSACHHNGHPRAVLSVVLLDYNMRPR